MEYKKYKNFTSRLWSTDAYPKTEMIYTWTKGPQHSVEVPPESSSLVQYDLIGQTVSSETIKSITGRSKETAPELNRKNAAWLVEGLTVLEDTAAEKQSHFSSAVKYKWTVALNQQCHLSSDLSGSSK